MVRVPISRPPTHPGEMLLVEFLEPLEMSQSDLAKALQVPFQRINELVRGKRGITPSTALRLAKYFNNTPSFWMNLQQRWDLYRIKKEEADVLKKIKPLNRLDWHV
ncbi:MAG: HigA family addiction module antitoxin [Cyanobacteria bacterium P01_E01_bin.34]